MSAMVTINEVTTLAYERGVAVITFSSPPVNSLTADVREGLVSAMHRALAEREAQAVVLICTGRTFFAGADIASFDRQFEGPGMREMAALMEDAHKPVIAAMHGTPLGGGLELSMACHYRIAAPATRLGLPEVKLGIVPGGSGTQRLPRLVGVERALQMITSGDDISAADALAVGLIDEIIGHADLRAGAIEFAAKVIAEGRPTRKVRELDHKLAQARGNPALFEEFRIANARKMRGFEALRAAIECVEAAVNLPFDTGLRFEYATFERLVQGPQSQAQRYLFFAEREAAKVPGVPKDTATRPVRSVGVIGAGTMGSGIAMCFANVGIPVALVETSEAALARGLANIRKNYEQAARRGRIAPAYVERRMGLLRGSTALEDLARRDLVIEAIYEDLEAKKKMLRQLDAIAGPEAILASNTSFLDIDVLAAQTQRPASVLGMHFFSPANVMRLVEVVRGARTAHDVLATAMKLAKQLGKVAVVSGVCHGFIGNRMLVPRQVEAFDLLLEGAAPWDIDRVLFEFGMPMGPFAMSDLAGLDIGWSADKSTSSTIIEVLCERGRLGQKSGSGFYDYDASRTPTPSPVTEQIVREFAARSGRTQRRVGDAEILERCLYPMINEGVKILQEGIACRASDIDLVWAHGYGWPRYKGGPMFHADAIGLANVRDTLRRLAQQVGPRCEPAGLLDQLVRDGRGLRDLPMMHAR